MSFDGREIANYILDQCGLNGYEITNLSLQKIVYFCHVWSLIEMRKPLVKHNFEAWEYGPVLPYLYSQFKHYNRRPIIGRAMKLDQNTGQQRLVEYHFDEATKDFLARVVKFYSQLSAAQLVDLSHAKGGPWERVWNHAGSVNPGMKIEDQDVINFYSKGGAPFTIH